MANLDNPLGFQPVGHLLGGEIRTVSILRTSGAAIYKGDMLKGVGATGTVEVAAHTDTTAIIGVSADWIKAAAAATTMCRVYVDPFIIFKVQSVTGQTPAATDVFGAAPIDTYAAGSTTLGNSITELGTITTGTLQWLVIGKVDSPDNVWGAHCDLLVIRNLGFFTDSSTGI